jgi:hypothetical protein
MRATCGIVLFAMLAGGGARAERITFPLTVDYPLMEAALMQQLHQERAGEAVLWGSEGGCRELTLRKLDVDGAPPRALPRAYPRTLGLSTSRVLSRSAFVGWISRDPGDPEVSADWRLRFTQFESQVYDAERRRTFMASRLWSVVRDRVEDEFGDFTLDMAPPSRRPGH